MSYVKASFLDDFDLPAITPENIKSQLLKVGKTHVVKKNSIESLPLSERLEYIRNEVYKALGRYRDFVRVIYDEEEFNNYLDFAISKGHLAFDTETNRSLDPLTCKIVGLCFYIPNTKPVYVPLLHRDPVTKKRLEHQVSEEAAKRALDKLNNSDIKLIYHNGKFDMRVCYNVLGVYPNIYWDTMIAAQLLDENSLARLKSQYKDNIDPTIDSYNIEKLFTGLCYEDIDPELFALYAAIDPFDTYKLFDWQKSVFEENGNERLYNLFLSIEMPIVRISAEMEDTGICIDLDFLKKLDSTYKHSYGICENKLKEILKPYDQQINYYQSLGKLDNPINFDSAKQLGIILYDILKITPIDGKRTTDADTLKALKVDFTEALLNYKHYSSMISKFTEPLQKHISVRDGKLHSNFHQMGTEDNNVRTGRFSSKDPNLQQIPSKEKIVRIAFKASEEFNKHNVENRIVFIKAYEQIDTPNGFKHCEELNKGDSIYLYEDDVTSSVCTIYSIERVDNMYKLVINNG